MNLIRSIVIELLNLGIKVYNYRKRLNDNDTMNNAIIIELPYPLGNLDSFLDLDS